MAFQYLEEINQQEEDFLDGQTMTGQEGIVLNTDS